MKRKLVTLLIGASAIAAVTGATAAFAEEVVETEYVEATVEEIQTEVQAIETEAVAAVESESETETEADDFIEGSALLSDYGYEAGTIDEKGWESKYLNLKFTPEKKMSMAVEDNKKLEEYYHRHGEDKIVANGEMVAKDEDDGYIQLTVEVNPNDESAEDILSRFAELEELELVSKAKDTEVAELNFKTCTGIYEKEKYMIGVCTDEENLALAFKIKYKDTDARKAFLACFEPVEATEEEESESEAEVKADKKTAEAETEKAESKKTDKESLSLLTPNEFEDEELITEKEETEAGDLFG